MNKSFVIYPSEPECIRAVASKMVMIRAMHRFREQPLRSVQLSKDKLENLWKLNAMSTFVPFEKSPLRPFADKRLSVVELSGDHAFECVKSSFSEEPMVHVPTNAVEVHWWESVLTGDG